MAEINDLNVVDASNTARFPENQLPSTVNNGARALEGIIARWDKDTNASITPGGTADVITVAANQTLSAYYDGLVIAFEASGTNTGSVTINVDSLGAKILKKSVSTNMAAGDIISGQKVIAIYDGTNFQIVSAFTDVTTSALAEEWASKTDGVVASSEYSAKAYAIGGTGVTDTAGKGAAKEWATAAEDDTVDGTEYSAKHYAAKAAADVVLTNADVVSTNADVVSTNADVASAAASAAAAGVSAGVFGVKGADLASADPLVVGTDGNYFDVTGTTTIATHTVAADRHYYTQFDGILTLTHHATTQDLPGGADITTAAGDVAEWQSTGANTVQCTCYTKADGTAVVGSGVTASSTDTFTNKTFDANGTGNSIANIEVADFANGTDGELITWDATGAPAVVAVGTAAQVLTSNGAGAAPTFQDAGGGGRVLLSSASPSASSLITFDGLFDDATYPLIEFIFYDFDAAASDVEMQFEVKIGGAWITANYSWTINGGYAASTTSAYGSTSDATGVCGIARNNNCASRHLLALPESTTGYKTIFSQGFWDDTNLYQYTGFSRYHGGTGAWQGIRFQPSTSTFTGEIKMYGYAG